MNTHNRNIMQNNEVKLATIKARLIAKIIDFLLLLAILMTTGMICAVGLVAFLNPEIANVGTSTDLQTILDKAKLEAQVETLLETNVVIVALPLFILLASIVTLYEIAFIAVKGQTIGKLATKIKIVRVDNGDVPGWKHSIHRFLLPTALAMIPVFGLLLGVLPYLSAFWNDSRQGWHDKTAKTIAVKVAP